mgnify:CR=1 FL=1
MGSFREGNSGHLEHDITSASLFLRQMLRHHNNTLSMFIIIFARLVDDACHVTILYTHFVCAQCMRLWLLIMCEASSDTGGASVSSVLLSRGDVQAVVAIGYARAGATRAQSPA